ncbi:MAG: RloB family protein [Corynebacterium sp.]|nr:RloB family protein [Corynebacterium sp.]
MVTEGETERLYFEQLQQALNLKDAPVQVVLEVMRSKEGSAPKNLHNAMTRWIDEKRKSGTIQSGDAAWVVLDDDSRPTADFAEVEAWVSDRKDRFAGFSKPQFEYWILLHFLKATGISTQRECMETLLREVPSYRKTDKNFFEKLDRNKIEAVKNHAEELHKKLTEQSSVSEMKEFPTAVTNLHILVEQILGRLR